MKRFLAGTAAGVLALTVAAGCAGELREIEPKLELRNAAGTFGENGRAGFTLRASGDVEALIAQAKKEAGSGAFSAEDADTLRKVYHSSITVAWDKGGDGDADDRAMIGATVDGVAGTEIRVVDRVAYARIPVAELAARFGASPADLTALQQQAPATIAGLDTLFGGGWVSVPSADLQELGAGTPGAVPSADPARSRELAADLQAGFQTFFENADVVRDARDDTHLTVTTSTVQAYEQGRKLVESLRQASGKAASATLDEALSGALQKPPADKPIVVDLWIKDDRFQAVEIDLLQFVEGSTGRATLRADVSTGTDITVPDGARQLDLKALLAATGTTGPARPV